MSLITKKESFIVEEESSCIVQEESVNGVVQEESCANDKDKDNDIIRAIQTYIKGIKTLASSSSSSYSGRQNSSSTSSTSSSSAPSYLDSFLVSSISNYVNYVKDKLNNIRKLPSEVQKRIVPEMDRIIAVAMPMDGVISLDKTAFKDLEKDPEMIKQISLEYKSCDLALRDLSFINKSLYMKIFGLKPN